MADPTYITQEDFYRDCKDVKPFLNANRELRGWTVEAGTVYRSEQTGAVEVLFQSGKDLGAPQATLVAVDTDGEWFYDAAIDTVYLQSATNPNKESIQAGEDFVTYFAAMALQASRLVDSALAFKRQIPFAKDFNGAYDPQIILATNYKLAEIITVVAQPAISERYAELLMNEAESGLLDRLISGKLKLMSDKILESDAGKIREVAVAGDIRLVETRGPWTFRAYDLVKFICTTPGVIGTAVIKAFGYDDTTKTLKALELTPTDGLVVNGIHQGIAGAWQVRFQGADAAEMDLNDEWEVEVRWAADGVTNSPVRSIAVGRGGSSRGHDDNCSIQSVTGP